MTEIRIQVISQEQNKTVNIHVVDAEAVLKKIDAGEGPLEPIARDLHQVVTSVLKNAEDTDKIEISPAGGVHHKANGEKIPFAL